MGRWEVESAADLVKGKGAVPLLKESELFCSSCIGRVGQILVWSARHHLEDSQVSLVPMCIQVHTPGT